jgi:pimeloyl-ACP methyl ester carboxylesterase
VIVTTTVNLDTHIHDVIAMLTAEGVENAVLVGHSYAGMVITGVADRVPERVDSLVYVDAFVPGDGDSCWTLTSDELREWYLSVGEIGYAVPPLALFGLKGARCPWGLTCPNSGTQTWDTFPLRGSIGGANPWGERTHGDTARHARSGNKEVRHSFSSPRITVVSQRQ